MTQHLVFFLLGLGNGAVFGALALALVVTYRSSGVVNFATGAIALYAAYTYAFLRKGELLVPFPGLPKSVDIGGQLPFWPAFVGAVLLAAILGVGLHFAVFKPLRNAPAASKAVASLGVMIVLQGVLTQKLGSKSLSVEPILPVSIVEIGGSRMRADRLWFALIIVLIGASLGAWFKFTRFGLASKAVAETEKGAILTGLAPHRIGLFNAAISAAVAGVSGILIAPIVPLVPSAYTLFIVPALAAALVAGLSSLWLAVAAGLVIGMVQSEIGFLVTQHSWLPQHGLAATLPLILIFGYLVIAGKPLPQRGAIVTRGLGRAPRPHHLPSMTLIAAIVGLVALMMTDGSARGAVITSLIFAVISLSLTVVAGFSGQISLAQLTLAGVAGFVLSRLTYNASVPFPVAPLLAAAASALVGVLIGLPVLRTRGLPVAIITLATAVALEAVWFNNPDFGNGIAGYPVPSAELWGLDLGIGAGAAYPRLAFGIVCLVTTVLVGWSVGRLRTSRLGAAMLAVRANERSAAAAGINVARTKLTAFAISGFIAGLGGSLLAYQQTLASPQTVSALSGLGFLAIAYVAGITSVSGGVLAGLLASGGIFAFAIEDVVPVGNWYATIAGAALVLNVLLRPEGLIASLHRFMERRYARRAGSRSATSADTDVSTPLDAAERDVARVAPSGPTLLTISGVTVRYGAVVAVSDVSLEVGSGMIVGLIGPNGAGKTTVIDAISGHARCSGRVTFDGQEVSSLKPHARARLGMGRTFQSLDLYDDLTVSENILVGTAARGSARRRADVGNAIDVCALLGLDEERETLVRELSHGHRQLVSIARALAGQPRILLLDEPASGLDSTESQWLGGRLRRVRDAGITMLLIDHDMSLILDVCDQVHVLDLGALIASGSPDEIRQNDDVRSAYLGAPEQETVDL